MRKTITLLLLLLSASVFAQARMTLNLYQDFKLGLIGDDKGNDAFTMDLLSEVNLELRQEDYGFCTVGFTYEKANLVGGDYSRWTLQFGYTFNQLFIENLEAAVKVNWGGIQRFEVSKPSIGLNTELTYNVNEWLGVSAMWQAVQRSDKAFHYGDDAKYTIDALDVDVSGFVGVVITLFKVKYSGTPNDY